MQRVSAQPGLFVLRVSPLCLAFITVACGAPARPTPRAAPPASVRAPELVRWARFAEALGWPTVGEPFGNEGHADAGAVAVVRVSPEARASYEHLVRDSELPDGSVVAIFHRDAPEGQPGPVYVMQKSGTAWQYLRLGPDGSVLGRESQSIANTPGKCGRCHAEGVADALFGIPRGKPRAALKPVSLF